MGSYVDVLKLGSCMTLFASVPGAEIAGQLRYYNAAVHRAAFAKPQFVRRLLGFE